MRSNAPCFDELRAFCEETPIIDCHDHSGECGPKHTDPIQAVICGYFPSDIHSASSDDEIALILDTDRPLQERWTVLKKAWDRTCHTGYAQVTRRVLKKFYGADDLSLDLLERIKDNLVALDDETAFDGILDEAKIAARIEDVWPDVKKVLDGSLQLTPRARIVISLPAYHGVRDRETIEALMAPVKRTVTSLDEYIDGCREIFDGHKRFGAVAFKDQSAYTRPIDYGNPQPAPQKPKRCSIGSWRTPEGPAPIRTASAPLTTSYSMNSSAWRAT